MFGRTIRLTALVIVIAVTVARCQSAGKSRSLSNTHALVGDAARWGLKQDSIDLFASNVVLQYIPTESLLRIFKEFLRLASPRAVMSHDIDLRDQFAYFDQSITEFNCLRFSPLMWRVISNPFVPLSRLRLSDYRRVFADSEFGIVEEHLTRGGEQDLRKVRLAKGFRQYSKEDLLVVRAWLVAGPRRLWE